MTRDDAEQLEPDYTVSNSTAALMAYLLPAAGKLIDYSSSIVLAGLALEGRGGVGMMFFLPFLLAVLYPLLLYLLNRGADLVREPGNPANLTLATRLLAISVVYMGILVYLASSPDRTERYGRDGFIITFMLFLSFYFFIQYLREPDWEANETAGSNESGPGEDERRTPVSPTVTLTTFPSEWEASLVADQLRKHGIPVKLAGTQLSMFRAEAPVDVRVMVSEEDADRASELLGQLDWGPSPGTT